MLLTAAVPVVIAACYGVPADYKVKLGKVVSGADQTPIQGIQVSCVHDGETVDAGVAEDAGQVEDAGEAQAYDVLTDENGQFSLDYSEGNPCDSLQLNDVDGAENGGDFAPKTVPFVDDGSEEVIEMNLATN